MPNRDRIFLRYSQDLANHRPSIKDSYACPLCDEVFAREDYERNTLTREHAIPSHLGGTYTVLTCKPCNNAHGSYLDSQLAKLLDASDAETGLAPFQAIANLSGNRLRLEMTIGTSASDPVRLKVIGKATNPSHVQAAKIALKEGPTSIPMIISFGYNPQRAQRALLRIVYLLTFGRAGYRFAYSPIGTAMRTEISNPSSLMNVFAGMFARLPLPDRSVPESFFLGDLTDQLKEPLYFAIFRLRNKQDHWYAMAYPSEQADFRDPAVALERAKSIAMGLDLRIEVRGGGGNEAR